MNYDNASTSDSFEAQLRTNLHRLADHAPQSVDLTMTSTADGVLASNELSSPGGRRRRIASVGAIAAILVGGAGLTIGGLQSGSDSGGASSPDEAVQQFAAALSNEDLLGMADMTVPEEAQALRIAATDAVSQAQRIGLLSQAFQLNGVAGFDIHIEGLTLADTPIGDRLVVVTSTAGTATAEFDAAALEIGDQARQLATDPTATETETVDLAEQPLSLVVQQRGERWYVSAGMSIAEAARADSGEPMPADLGIVPEGSASPEAAASAFYGRLANFDLTGASGLLAPGEGDVFRRYAGLWMPGAEDGIASMKADGTAFTITTPLEYERVAESDGRVVLKPVRYGIDITTARYDYTVENSANPMWPTLVFTDSGMYILPEGQALPASLDDPIFATAEFLSNDDVTATENVFESDAQYNMATTDEDGTSLIDLMETPVRGDRIGVETTHVELVDGCTTMTVPESASRDGSPQSDMEEPGIVSAVMGAYGAEQLDDRTFRSCSNGGDDVVSTFGGVPFLWAGDGGAMPELPSIVATENGGEWFVSPIGTISELVIGPLRGVPDGASIVDVPMFALVAGMPDRATFNLMVDEDAMGDGGATAPECAAVTERDADGKTVLVAQPDITLYRACVDNSFGMTSSSSDSMTDMPLEDTYASESSVTGG